MKKTFRAIALAGVAVIGAASLAMFAGCDTDYPEVTITYEFRGEKYEVDYKLSRKGAPQTVQHFIELADAGYYTDTVIHDYQSEGTFLYGGGYTLDDQGDLVEKDYFTEMRELESKGATFTKTVFASGRDMAGYFADLASDGLTYVAEGKTYTAADTKIPLYTLHGEFRDNGVTANSKTPSHRQGTIAMYYTDSGNGSETSVGTIRSDGGENSIDGEAYQEGDHYKFNCATSLFYTFTGAGTRSDLDAKYAAFGTTVDYEGQLGRLVTAINDYANSLDDTVDEDGDGDPFTKVTSVRLNSYDPIDIVRGAKIPGEFSVPVEPIIIRSVTVKKY